LDGRGCQRKLGSASKNGKRQKRGILKGRKPILFQHGSGMEGQRPEDKKIRLIVDIQDCSTKNQ